MAPIMQLMERRNISYNFVFSGQHKTTITDIQKEFGIKTPDTTLYTGRDITGIIQMIIWGARILLHVLLNKESVWQGDKEGVVLNHGDTFSTLLGTVTAKVSGLKSAHIESGLRSFNLFHPFPEEIIRRLTFMFSDLFFAPGDWALKNIEAYRGEKINTINNTLLDSLKASENAINEANIDIPDFDFGVVSIHRFENIFSKKQLTIIIDEINNIAKSSNLLFILHKPTLEKLKQYSLYEKIESNINIELRPRYSYFQFIKLVKASKFVITDGGSNQEECYYLGKPCLILRKATERQEGIGTNACLSEFKPERIEKFIKGINDYKSLKVVNNDSPSDLIVDYLIEQSF